MTAEQQQAPLNILLAGDDADDCSFFENALKKTFSFDIKTLSISSKTLKVIVKAIPENWTNDTEQKTDVLFLWDDYNNKKSLALIKDNPDIDTLIYIQGAIIWNVKRENYSKSGMNKFIGTVVYKNMTARNINTVRKLLELIENTDKSKLTK